MTTLHLGASSLNNESRVVFDSSLKLRISFRCKRFRRIAERWRFRVQQMSGNEQRTKHEQVRFAKSSESLRYILKQYGVSVGNLEENKQSSRLDDLNCEQKHETVPSSKNTTEELRWQERYHETVSAVDTPSGQNHQTHFITGALFTSLLPVLGFCIVCIIGTLHYRKTSRGHHHKPLAASDDHKSSPEYGVGSGNQEEVNEAYSRVELEYKRFLLECGVSES